MTESIEAQKLQEQMQELTAERRRLEGLRGQAQEREANAKYGTSARQKAFDEGAALADQIAEIDARIANPEDFEEKVTLLAPNAHASGMDNAVGAEWVNGRAEGVPRSRAERIIEQLDGYAIEGEQ